MLDRSKKEHTGSIQADGASIQIARTVNKFLFDLLRVAGFGRRWLGPTNMTSFKRKKHGHVGFQIKEESLTFQRLIFILFLFLCLIKMNLFIVFFFLFHFAVLNLFGH
ncbi:hypothetical protein LguiA_017870 [Lonicera macranthoides]